MSDAPSKDALNQRIRAYHQRRSWRPLTPPEQDEYQRLLTAWTAADQAERLARKDVIEVA